MNSRSRTNSTAAPTPVDEDAPNVEGQFTLHELKQEERRIEAEEEAEIERRRQAAQKLAAERGLVPLQTEDLSSKEATPHALSPIIQTESRNEEPSQLPTPLASEDEEQESALSTHQAKRDDDAQ